MKISKTFLFNIVYIFHMSVIIKKRKFVLFIDEKYVSRSKIK